MRLFTIGFTHTTAERFFGRIREARVQRVLDVRLNNVSQLSGFAKKDDLRYFLQEITGVGYSHDKLLAPTQEMLEAYKKHGGNWVDYERQFLELMSSRAVERLLRPGDLDGSCLLCSEHTADRCHRRLVAEYLRSKWSEPFELVHL